MSDPDYPDPCTCGAAEACDGSWGICYPLQVGASCVVLPCRRERQRYEAFKVAVHDRRANGGEHGN